MKTLKETNLIQQAIRALEEDGRLSPEIVVKAATNPKSPLHKYFEWDDSKAAESYRIQQARQIIKIVSYETKVDDIVVQSVSYVRDPAMEHKEQGYVSLEQLKAEPENAMVMVLSELARAEALLSRAEILAKVLDLSHLIIPVAKKVKKTHRQFKAIQEQGQPSAA